MDIDKNLVRRVLAKHYRPMPDDNGPSRLTFIGHAKDSLWLMNYLFRREHLTPCCVSRLPNGGALFTASVH